MIYIYINPTCLTEKKYIINVIFNEWLGLTYEIGFHEENNYKILFPNNQSIFIPDLFLSIKDEKWLSKETLPKTIIKKPFYISDSLIFSDLPYIFFTENKNKNDFIPLDIFGSIFYLISSYEENVIQQKDQHNRFFFKESLAYKFNFLNRPVANEYLEILWHFLIKACPILQRKKRKYLVEISHDVDRPYQFHWMNIKVFIKTLGHFILKKYSLYKAFSFLINYLVTKVGFIEKDPFYTFDWIMDISEQYNTQSTFNFIAGNHSPMDAQYLIYDPKIIKIMKKINQRGHLIGLHGSYNSYNDFNILSNEYEILSQTMKNVGITQRLESSRQHYLRWDSSITPNLLNQAGLKYDTTLTHAEIPGFRCGTCYEFPMYDLKKRQQLSIIQKPLIVMECSVLDYLGLSSEKGKSLIITLAQECKKFNGTFSLLWHNSELNEKWKKRLYLDILAEIFKIP